MYTLQYKVDEVIMFKQQQYTRQGLKIVRQHHVQSLAN